MYFRWNELLAVETKCSTSCQRLKLPYTSYGYCSRQQIAQCTKTKDILFLVVIRLCGPHAVDAVIFFLNSKPTNKQTKKYHNFYFVFDVPFVIIISISKEAETRVFFFIKNRWGQLIFFLSTFLVHSESSERDAISFSLSSNKNIKWWYMTRIE